MQVKAGTCRRNKAGKYGEERQKKNTERGKHAGERGQEEQAFESCQSWQSVQLKRAGESNCQGKQAGGFILFCWF